MNQIFNGKAENLTESEYNRPEITYTDTLQNNTKMAEKLQGYERVFDISDVSKNTHVRYVTLKEGKQRFCLGGLLKFNDDPRFVILSNGRHQWSVQRHHFKKPYKDGDKPIFDTVFFKAISNEEKLEKIVKEKDDLINKLKKKLTKLHNRYNIPLDDDLIDDNIEDLSD